MGFNQMRNLRIITYQLRIDREIAAIPIAIASDGPLGHGFRECICDKSVDFIVVSVCFDMLNGRIIWSF